MYNTAVLSLILSVLPLLVLLFIVVLLVQKFYVKIRSRYDIKVNCWFCNENARVPYAKSNNWHCPHCEQYNGFNKDGDYNCEIFQQLDCSHSSSNTKSENDVPITTTTTNGFCNACNEAQRLKVEKLSQFEPKNETHFDRELKVYKANLEEQYRLCTTCDRHLRKVLREKKKIVLGSKFLDYVMRGANIMKNPQFANMRQQQQETWKSRFGKLILLCAIIDLLCLLTRLTLPTLSADNFTNIFGNFLGEHVFLLSSHVIAFLRVVLTYLETLASHGLVVKVQLFCRTVFLMLLYSLGLRFPQFLSVNFPSIFMLATPYAMISLALAYNVMDNLRFSRYTFLLGIWSLVAADLPTGIVSLTPHVILLLSSLITVMTSVIKPISSQSNDKLHDESAQSFHRMYSEDFLSDLSDDDETMSLLSNNSSGNRISSSVRSFNQNQRLSPNSARLRRSPMATRGQQAFNTIYAQQPNIQFGVPMNYAASTYNCPSAQPKAFYPYEVNSVYAGSSISQAAAPSMASAPRNLHSPFSSSASSVSYQQRQSHVLTPSRFSMNSLQSNSLWPTENNYNYNAPNHVWPVQNVPQAQVRQPDAYMLFEGRAHENMSRSSSHSSGFESQSNERNLNEQNWLAEGDLAGSTGDVTLTAKPRDSFNFQLFDAQLPNYRRGDLLRKWKDTQVVS